MSETSHQTQPVRDSDQGLSLASIVFGLILISLGVVWILDIAGLIGVTWTLVGGAALILIGVALLIGSREGPHGGMIFLGIVLSVVVILATLASWPTFEGGVGDRSEVPATFTEVEESYNWALGSQFVDLRNVDFPEGETELEVHLGTGDLEVRIPTDIAYRIEWSVGLGDAKILDYNQSGISLDGIHESDGYEDADVRLLLDIRVGMGAVEVRQ